MGHEAGAAHAALHDAVGGDAVGQGVSAGEILKCTRSSRIAQQAAIGADLGRGKSEGGLTAGIRRRRSGSRLPNSPVTQPSGGLARQ